MNKIWDTLSQDLRENPFFQFSEETDFVPAWDRIEIRHIRPAIEFAIALAEKNWGAVIDNKKKPTFKNTVEALEKGGEITDYFMNILANYMPKSPAEEKEHEAIYNELWLRYIRLVNDTYSNAKLFKRFKDVEKESPFKKLSKEKKYLFELYKNALIDSGAKLPQKKKLVIRELENTVQSLERRIHENMKLAERDALLVIDDIEKLKGISPFMQASAAQKAADTGQPGKWAFDTDSYYAVMRSAQNREVREKFWHLYNRLCCDGPYDNRGLIIDLMTAEHKIARALKFKSKAAYNLSFNLADTPKTVEKFIERLRQAALPEAKKELKLLKKLAQQDGIKLEPWDSEFYGEQLKKKVLGFDDESLRPYFELENVLQGTFRHFEKLFQIEFKENKTYPLHHPDVRAYDVVKKGTDKKMGTLFLDLFERENKPPGIAWNFNVLSQGMFQGAERRPIDVVVTKFLRAENEPTLLRHFDVLTIFHELGHATHDIMSKCHYASTSGMRVSEDFVEFPSMMQENWAYEPAVLDDFARHYKTGALIPDDIKQKLHDSRQFMGGSWLLDRIKESQLDLAWYNTKPSTIKSAEAFEKKVAKPFTLMKTYDALRSPHFSYTFGGGYNSTFYGYRWAEVREADAFGLFEKNGLYDRKTAKKYTKIPEQGGTRDGDKLFKDFRGHAVQEKHYLKRHGLGKKHFDYAAAFKPAENNAPANDNTGLAAPLTQRSPNP